MKKNITFKNTSKESLLISQRLLRLFICIMILAGILFLRLGYLQIIRGSYYKTLSTNNAIGQVPTTPSRGLIYDRNGYLLADNNTIQSLDITRNQMGSKAHLKASLKELQALLPDTIDTNDIKNFEADESLYHPFEPQPIVDRLSESDMATFYVNRYKFPGVSVDANFIRDYPFNSATGSVVGYVGMINAKELNEVNPENYAGTNYIGKTGIEKYFETELHGTVGATRVEKDASGQALKQLSNKQATPGTNLYLTIDANMQKIAEAALSDDSGAVVAIQPSTGQILTLYSSPGFDPNTIVNGDDINKAYAELSASPSRPLFDRAVAGHYSPGSTIKPFLALGYLDSGVITPDFTINDPGYYQIPGSVHKFNNWDKTAAGAVNVVRAITISNDTFFFNLANMAGIDKMDAILSQFGFGKTTGIQMNDEIPGDLPIPKEKHGHLMWKNRHWYPGDTVVMGIGQGYIEVTPLQLAAAVATIANRGWRYQPTLLYGTQAPNQPFVYQQREALPPVVLKNPKNWDTVIAGMVGVMTSPEGTGFHYGPKPTDYDIAGKTGTAQLIKVAAHTPDSDLKYNLRTNSLFIAFAPVEKPEIAIAVVAEHTTNAAPVARKLIDYYLLCVKKMGPCNVTP